MRRGLLVLLTAVALTLATSTAALADPEGVQPAGVTDPGLLALITDDDVFSSADLSLLLATPATPLAPAGTPTQHYGPYASESTDSGTCGDWATDTYDRHFTVKTTSDGTLTTFTVVEQFKGGSFQTLDVPPTNPSPGSCDTTDGSPPGTVNAEVVGSMQGYFIIPLPAGTEQTSSSPYCDATVGNETNDDCTTTTFINTHFTPACYPATCPVTTFFFHYSAGDQLLVEHEWKNASDDRGGNHGDIRSNNL